MKTPKSANRPWRLPAFAFWAAALLVLLPPLAVLLDEARLAAQAITRQRGGEADFEADE